MTPNIAENRYKCKRYAAKYDFRHLGEVPRSKETKRKEPKTALQATFMRRIEEVLRDKGIKPGTLASHGVVPQKTLDDVLKGISDPRLGTVALIAKALGIHNPVDLLREAPPKNVTHLHRPLPPMIDSAQREPKDSGKVSDRKKRRR